MFMRGVKLFDDVILDKIFRFNIYISIYMLARPFRWLIIAERPASSIRAILRMRTRYTIHKKNYAEIREGWGNDG